MAGSVGAAAERDMHHTCQAAAGALMAITAKLGQRR